MKAVYNNEIIAESSKTILLGETHYFPPDSVDTKFLTPSETTSVCPIKGKANYFSVSVNGKEIKDAGWYYKNPNELYEGIRDYVAFWHSVEILDD